MHCAAIENHADIVDMLIKARANPKLQDMEGDQPMHWAATKGHVEVCVTGHGRAGWRECVLTDADRDVTHGCLRPRVHAADAAQQWGCSDLDAAGLRECGVCVVCVYVAL